MARDAGRQGLVRTRESRNLRRRIGEKPHPARRLGWLLGCVLAGILAAQLFARDKKDTRPTRVVSGVVSDASENPIAGAVVTLKDLQKGKEMATYTGQSGTYQFSDLQITRDYEVQASYKGKSSRVRKISTIDPRSRIVLNLRIPPPPDEE